MIDISSNRNTRRNRNNGPLGTSGGSDFSRTLDEELDAIRYEEDGQPHSLDYYLEGGRNMPMSTQPQNGETPRGFWAGARELLADLGAGAARFGGKIVMGIPAWFTSNLATVDNIHDRLGDEEIRNIAARWNMSEDEVRASISNIEFNPVFKPVTQGLSIANNAYQGAIDDTRRWIAGDSQSQLGKIGEGAGSTFGFLAGKGALTKVFGPVVSGTIESASESGSLILDKLAEDPTLFNDPRRFRNLVTVANMQFVPNAIADITLDKVGDWIGGKLPSKGLAWKLGREFFGEQLQEPVQESYQVATEIAAEKTLQSGDVSIGNFLNNLAGEWRRILPYTDENGNEQSGYFMELLPEVSASTGLSSALMIGLGLPNPKKRGHFLTQAGRQRMVANALREDLRVRGLSGYAIGRNIGEPTETGDLARMLFPTDTSRMEEYLEELKHKEEEISPELYAMYESLGADADTDIDAMKDLQDMEAERQRTEDSIDELKYAIRDLRTIREITIAPSLTTQPVQDDTMDFFSDLRSNVEYASPPVPEEEQPDATSAMTSENEPSSSILGALGREADMTASENAYEVDEAAQLARTEQQNDAETAIPTATANEAAEGESDNQKNIAQVNEVETGAVTGLLGNENSNLVANTGEDAQSSEVETPEPITSVTYKGSDDKEHTLTARTGEFDDSHPNQKKYFGRYVEFTDENGKIVARYSPHTGILQTFDGVNDADKIESAITSKIQQSLRSFLGHFGYVDEHGKLIDDGNKDFRREYRARLNTTPEGLGIHSSNVKISTGKRQDTRGLKKKYWDDYWSERRGFKRVMAKIYGQIMKTSRKVASANWEKMTGETRRKYKERARTTARLEALKIRGFAHAYGMPIEEFYRDGMNFRAVFSQEAYDEDGRKTRGYMHFIPAGTIDEQGRVYETAVMELKLTRFSDPSTSLHEFAHGFLRELERLVTTVPDLPQKIYDDWRDLTKWLGISDLDFAHREAWTEEQKIRYKNAQEKFASGAEKYYATGKAPSISLWWDGIFKKTKTWMANIYRGLENIRYTGEDKREHDIEITPETRRFFDNLFRDVPYVPSEANRQARLALSREVGQGSQSEEFHRQSVSGQEGGLRLGRQNSIQDLLGVMRTETGRKNSGQVWVDYARVSQEEAERISQATGLNITDRYVHTITGEAVAHVNERHGEHNEQRQDQIPLTDADIERIPEIIANPDEIVRGAEKTTWGLNDSIVYKKRINGHVLIVEEVRTRRGKLAFHTMRESKAGYDYDLSTKGNPLVRDKTKSQAVTSDNDPIPEVQSAHALSGQSVTGGGNDVNSTSTKPSRIGRSNDTFVSQDDMERFEQLVLHGTGHIILDNEFSLEFIGSGEGSQVYGWGLYFAQNRDVAEYYRRVGLDNSDAKIHVSFSNGKSISLRLGDVYKLSSSSDSSLGLPEGVTPKGLFDAIKELRYVYTDNIDGWDFKKAKKEKIRELKGLLKQRSQTLQANSIRETIATLEALEDFDIEGYKRGNVYKASIPDDDVLLDWDATIDNQPDNVKKGIKKLIANLARHNPSIANNLAKAKTGKEFYHNLHEALKPMVERGAIKTKKHGIIKRQDMAASLLLNQVGIPGLRYGDWGHARNNSDTHNFVIWNTDMIKPPKEE